LLLLGAIFIISGILLARRDDSASEG